MTGLHWAAKRGHYQICDILLKNNSHINALDIMGRTPLIFALISQKLNLFQLLLYNRADPYLIQQKRYQQILSQYCTGLFLKEFNKCKKIFKNVGLVLGTVKKNKVWLQQRYSLIPSQTSD